MMDSTIRIKVGGNGRLTDKVYGNAIGSAALISTSKKSPCRNALDTRRRRSSQASPTMASNAVPSTRLLHIAPAQAEPRTLSVSIAIPGHGSILPFFLDFGVLASSKARSFDSSSSESRLFSTM